MWFWVSLVQSADLAILVFMSAEFVISNLSGANLGISRYIYILTLHNRTIRHIK
jgi:hypothetical protein